MKSSSQHAQVDDLVVTDVAPFTLGVEISRDVGGVQREGYFLPVIHRNTTIPVSRVERVGTCEANQTHIRIRIYQGEARTTKDNLLLGDFEVSGIPRGPAGQPVDIRFTYDINGVLEVEATIVETKQKASHVVTRHAQTLSETEIRLALEAMQALKAHPREDAVNRLLLRRAERLYQELPMRERQLLDSLLAGFEEVLELRDAEAIDRYREELQAFVSTYDEPE
jgi:molecular chaperone HscC